MSKSFELVGIDWWGKGYHGCPDSLPKSSWPAPLKTPEWETWTDLLRRAKQGDFSRTPALLDLYRKASTPVAEAACATLLGDAGDAVALENVTRELRDEGMDYEKIINFCDILQTRGRLSELPLLLECFERISTIEDADIIPSHISRMLEPEPGPLSDVSDFSSLEDYRQAVLERYEETRDKLGSDDRLVFLGKPYGVVPLAEALIDRLRKPHVQIFWRRRFEAPTGIDCSAFYDEDRSLQPLAASEIVEGFLESPQAADYQDGVRYFFGHRIPN